MSASLMLAVLAGLAIGWALQGWLVVRQTRRFNVRLRVLRTKGLTAVGKGGSRLRGHTFVALAAGRDGRVAAAEVLRGRTVFASTRPAPGLVGRPVADIAAGDGDSTQARAAAQAAEAILEAPESAWARVPDQVAAAAATQ